MSSKRSPEEYVNPFETTASANANSADKELSESLKKDLYGSDIKKEVEETLKALAEQANETGKSNSRKDLSVNRADSSTHKAAGTLPLLRQELTTDAFIAEKREVGLVRMSLVAKRKEIHKLEEEVSRAEKRLRQQQEQLSSTRDKFNNYLKHSTLEQDAAVRRADLEAKAREEKTIEIKRLSALINRTEASIKKIELRLESCYTYKKFLDELTKPRWFYDVLIKMRVEKAMNKIVSHAESVYEEQAEQIRLTYNDAIQARLEAERSQRDAKEKGKRGSMIMTDLTRSLILSTKIVPLEEQLRALHSTMEQEVQRKVDALTESITKEVDALSLAEVRSGLEEFCDEAHAPSYFTEVDQLLEVFINVEEGNLFLIQNCQELEEELEGIALNFLNEKEDMESMTRQRHAQMEALANKIRTAQGKLRQLEERSQMLDASSSSDSAGQGASLEKSARSSVSGKAINKENTAASLSPEGFKRCVEQSIANIFRTLTSGDNYFKALAAAHQQLEQKRQEQEQEQEEQHLNQQETQEQQQQQQEGKSEEKEQFVNGNNTLANKSNTTLKGAVLSKEHNSLTPLHNTARGKVMQSKSKLISGNSINSPKSNMAASVNAAISAKAKVNDESGDAGANMGPIDMLTIIENKLEEYHRLIADPNKNVDDNLIANVMKQSDKERRRQARQEHMIQQAAEQEERVRKALLRSQAPVVKRTGKPVLPRSHLPTMSEDEEFNAYNSNNLYKNGPNKLSSRSFTNNNNNNSGNQRRHRRKNNGNNRNIGKNDDAYYSTNNNRLNDEDDDDDGEEFFR